MRRRTRILPLLAATACAPVTPISATGGTGGESESQGQGPTGSVSSGSSLDGDSGDSTERGSSDGTSSTESEGSTEADESTTSGEESSTGEEDLYPEGWSREVSPNTYNLATNATALYLQEKVDAEDDGYIEAVRVRRLDPETGESVADFDLEVAVNNGTPAWLSSGVRMDVTDAGIVLSDKAAGRVAVYHPETAALVFETFLPEARVLDVIWSGENEPIFALAVDNISGDLRLAKLSSVDGAQDTSFSFEASPYAVNTGRLGVTSDRVWIAVEHSLGEHYLAAADIETGASLGEFAEGFTDFFLVGDNAFGMDYDYQLWPIDGDPASPPLVNMSDGISPRTLMATDDAVFVGASGWRVQKRLFPDWSLDPAFGQGGDLSAPPFPGGGSSANDLDVQADALYVLRRHALDGVDDTRVFVDRRSQENGSL